MSNQIEQLAVRVNCSIEGDPALWLIELKRRGIVGSNKEAVVQGLIVLRERLVKLDHTKGLVAKTEGNRW